MKTSTFINRLKEAMRKKGYKQIDIVNRSNISKSLLNKYLKGIAEPKHNNLDILAEILEVNPVWLLGYDVPMSPDANVELINFFNNTKEKKEINEIYAILQKLNYNQLVEIKEFAIYISSKKN